MFPRLISREIIINGTTVIITHMTYLQTRLLELGKTVSDKQTTPLYNNNYINSDAGHPSRLSSTLEQSEKMV